MLLKSIVIVAALVLLPAAASAGPLQEAVRAVNAETFVIHRETRTSTRARVDSTLAIASLTASGVAGALTASCISSGECVELNPIMRGMLGSGVGRAVVAKALVNGALVYVVYKLLPEGNFRTTALGLLAGINTADAVHDIRVMREIQRRRR